MRYIPTFNTDINAQIEHNRRLIMALPENVQPGIDEPKEGSCSYLLDEHGVLVLN